MNEILIAVAGIISATFGSLGLGGGGVLILYFKLFTNVNQILAQGINLLFFIPSALISIIIYSKKKLIDFKLFAVFSFLGLIGAIAGSFLANFIDGKILSKLFALLLLIMGFLQFKHK